MGLGQRHACGLPQRVQSSIDISVLQDGCRYTQFIDMHSRPVQVCATSACTLWGATVQDSSVLLCFKHWSKCPQVQFLLILSLHACRSPSLPQARLDLGRLARVLNRIDSGRQAGMQWSASSLVDTGPILR